MRLVVDEHKPVASVARDHGLWESILTSWVRQAKVDSGHGQSGELKTSEREDLARLRRENQVLRMARKDLTKATAFFAKESK